MPVLPSDNEEIKRDEQRIGPRSVGGASRPASQKGSNIDDEVQNSPIKRLQKGKELVDPYVESEESDMWYLYLPSVIGAVLAVGVVGVLSLSSWRKKQN